jgi:hypothetical protein
MNDFYVYVNGDKFIRITENKKGVSLFNIRQTKDINKASYFVNKKNADSWKLKITFAFPKAELKQAVLTIKT